MSGVLLLLIATSAPPPGTPLHEASPNFVPDIGVTTATLDIAWANLLPDMDGGGASLDDMKRAKQFEEELFKQLRDTLVNAVTETCRQSAAMQAVAIHHMSDIQMETILDILLFWMISYFCFSLCIRRPPKTVVDATPVEEVKAPPV